MLQNQDQDLSISVCQTFSAAEKYRAAWNRLSARSPLQTWEWLSNWWTEIGARQSGVQNRLLIAIVTNSGDEVIGIAPLYVQSSWIGRMLRILGDGRACSDYAQVLVAGHAQQEVSNLLANWIVSKQFAQDWGAIDLMQIEGYSREQTIWPRIFDQLLSCGWRLEESELESAWVLGLEGTLDQVQRKGRDSLRRKNKNLLKLVDSSEVEIECVDEVAHLDLAWPDFVRLHQIRRRELGQPGCFACKQFEKFLYKSTRQLIERQQARLWFATKQGVRFGTVLTLISDSGLFVYQSGIDSSFQAHDPGHLCNAYLIRWAHENGYQFYDFLRGDELYKKHLGAQRCELYQARLVAPTWSAHAKEGLFQIAKKTKQQSSSLITWVRQSKASSPNSSAPPTIES
jgi:CelD/BcsL family acetyltransferase involved in cellulose biosynthesis